MPKPPAPPAVYEEMVGLNPPAEPNAVPPGAPAPAPNAGTVAFVLKAEGAKGAVAADPKLVADIAGFPNGND